jgi:hypothetical protein
MPKINWYLVLILIAVALSLASQARPHTDIRWPRQLHRSNGI